nr:hypothetical protein [Tanacetum cinerariifolium]
MDDEPMWAADRVVAPTPGSAITIPETENEFAIKGNHLTLVKGNQFDARIKTDPHKHIYEFLRICDMFKYGDTKNEAVRLMMFPLSLSGEAKTWLDELNEGTVRMWDELRTAFISRFFPPALETFSSYHRCSNLIKTKTTQSWSWHRTNDLSIDSVMKHTYSNDDTCFSIDVIDEILEEYFDALLNEGSEILYSIEGTIIEEKLFVEFNEVMAINIKENSEFES